MSIPHVGDQSRLPCRNDLYTARERSLDMQGMDIVHQRTAFGLFPLYSLDNAVAPFASRAETDKRMLQEDNTTPFSCNLRVPC